MNDAIHTVLLLIAASMLMGAMGVRIWHRHLGKKAIKWPLVEGTVESGRFEVVAGGGMRNPEVKLPVFSFSYQVAGNYYAGRFALLPYITDPFITDTDGSFMKRMIGRKVQVHYDPLRPGVWFISNELIEGCKIEQKLGDDWISYAPED